MTAIALQTVARGEVVLAGCPPQPYTIWFRVGESVVSVECGGVTRWFKWDNKGGKAPYRPGSEAHRQAVIARFEAIEPEIDDDALDQLNRELASERVRKFKHLAHDRQLPAGDRS